MRLKNANGLDTKPRSGIWKGNKRAISHTITPDLLQRADERAAQLGQTRTAIINLALFEYLERSK